MSDIEHQTPFLAMYDQDKERDDGKASRSERTGSFSFLGALTCIFVLFGFISTLRVSSSTVFSKCGDTLQVFKKFHPGKWNPKPVHHGRVDYSIRDDPEKGRVFTRKFTAPCAYGILVFAIGPAQDYEPFAYDIFDDQYVYEDNGGLCALFPSYYGTQSGSEPFWNKDDPTEIMIPFTQMTRISTLVHHNGAHEKPVSDHMAKRMGDYVLIDKGNFYSAEFYQSLKERVNRWKEADEERLEDIIAELLETM